MARDKESMQDNALWAMEKISRQNPGASKPMTLAEQFKELEKSPDQKRREMSKYDWNRDLQDAINKERHAPGSKLVAFVQARYKDDIEKFRTSGAPYRDVIKFIESKQEEYINM